MDSSHRSDNNGLVTVADIKMPHPLDVFKGRFFARTDRFHSADRIRKRATLSKYCSFLRDINRLVNKFNKGTTPVQASESFGDRLKRLREKKKLSAKEVARQAGVPESTYREWEYGRPQKLPPFSRLSEVLDVPLSELITGKSADLDWITKGITQIEDQIRKLKSEWVSRI